MVVYTANGSGGMGYIGSSGECTDGSGTLQDLQNDEALYKHYATFITQAVAAQAIVMVNRHQCHLFLTPIS